ncbi:acetate--CoA ligase [Aestuariivirga sp.]|uniref:acetate--CoA ligase n=1 Tax=Aestuariivirga sp. TaxID=2650926 RepID=UPI00391C8400
MIAPDPFWQMAERDLAGFSDNKGINIAHETCDCHVERGDGARIAIRWLGAGGEARNITYAELSRASNRFANVLRSLGIGSGDKVFTLLGRVPELHIAALGTWKRGAVFCPLFSAFGPEPVKARMLIAKPSLLVTSSRHYLRKIKPILEDLPFLKHIILTDGGEGGQNFSSLLTQAEEDFQSAPTAAEDLAILHFTSGTTGKPKAAMHVHAAVIAHKATARHALDLRQNDVYWCTADPGWVTGTSYGIIAPLAVGATLILDEAEFDAERWYANLEKQHVNVWYTAPTAVRMLIRAGDELPRRYDLSALRFIASVGEPLHPEAVIWGRDVLGRPIHDNWWQSETGGIMIANTSGMEIRPGSMGKPLPGITAGIVKRSDTGVYEIIEPGVEGELALRPGWPSMFRGYLGEDERYRRCFAEGWYLTGDMARRDAEGYYWFVGRADDVIKSSGHLIGPFEVEAALLSHGAVAEAAAIGLPDPIAGEVVKAFVSLKPGRVPDEALLKELLGHARKLLGPAVAPRQIAFTESLPRTRSGKIMRRLLKARELGLPEGDLSTLETSA